MQYRMKTHQLNQEQIEELLNTSETGSLATLNMDGSPYVTPVHFIYYDDALYIHGLPVGQKISNIKSNPNVSFNVFDMDGLLFDPDEKPCDTNTKYTSVIIQGKAALIEEVEKKYEVLKAIVSKYTPQLVGKVLPQNMVKGTAVIRIGISQITGKFYG